MNVYGRLGWLLAIWSASLVGISLLLAGCGEDSPQEMCQTEEDCYSNQVCTADGRCEARAVDAGGEPGGSARPEIARVELTPTKTEVGLGLTMALEAEAFDADGARVPVALFEWESTDPEIVSVDDRGVLTAKSLGMAAITAHEISAPRVEGRAQIQVVEGEIASVVVEPDPIQVLPDRTRDAVATAYNEAVEAIAASPAVWRVEDETIALVNAEGVVKGVAPGQTRLIANVEGVEGSATVEVLPMPVDRVEISPSQPTAAVGETVQLEATGYDEDGVVLSGRQTTWTSQDTSIATVDGDGLVRGAAVGSVVISVEMGVVTAHVAVTIGEANHPPIARDHLASTQEDSHVDLTLGASDEDGDALSFALESGPSHGTVSSFDSAAGTLTYTPEADYVGTDSFTFSATDGEDSSGVATVTIRIAQVNDAPVARSDTATTAEDTAVTVDVLANDNDPEGDTLTVSLSAQPTHGSAEVANNAVTYTPEADFHGSDSLTYSISDGNGGTDTATVTITINAVNDAPVADAGSDQTVAEGDTVTLDGTGSSDDESAITYSWSFTSQPTGSSATLGDSTAAQPTFTADVAGDYVLELTVSDGTLTATDTVTITAQAASAGAD